jgi:predicted transcriptional regulator
MQGDIKFCVLITPELRERLRVAARECRTSMSRLAEIAIVQFLATDRVGN